jgi:hypothetical protein
MKLQAYQFTSTGWNTPLDASLDSAYTMIVVFGPADYEPCMPAINDLYTTFPESKITGCSTAGEIFAEDVLDNSLSVAILKFRDVKLRLVSERVNSAEESFIVASDIASQLDSPDLRAVFVLTDGLCINGAKLAEGFNTLAGKGVTVTGGMSADGSRFKNTWVLVNGQPESHQVAAMGMYGDSLIYAHGSKGGWDVIKSDIQVSHAIGNILYELNDRPALEFYREYMGKKADGLPATGLLFPLALKDEGADDEVTVRTILSIDEEEQSITFAGTIPDGSSVQLMRANFDRLIEGAAGASQEAVASIADNQALFNIAISCVGRRLVLGDRSHEELESVCAGLPQGTRQIGFYSYGELSPQASGRCNLHNQTMTITLIGER